VREAAASLPAEHAETMRVVDHQPGVEALGERQQAGQGSEIAVHAEHRVAEDQLASGGARGEQTFEYRQIGVRVALAVGARELHGVDQGSVVEPVGEDRVVAPDQRRNDPQVGQVAGREEQGARKAGERGELLLEHGVRAEVAADQMRGAAADAPGAGAGAGGVDQRRVIGQAEVIVAAEADQRAAVNLACGPQGQFEGPAVRLRPSRCSASSSPCSSSQIMCQRSLQCGAARVDEERAFDRG
jgi:hypothetical protein